MSFSRHSGLLVISNFNQNGKTFDQDHLQVRNVIGVSCFSDRFQKFCENSYTTDQTIDRPRQNYFASSLLCRDDDEMMKMMMMMMTMMTMMM